MLLLVTLAQLLVLFFSTAQDFYGHNGCDSYRPSHRSEWVYLLIRGATSFPLQQKTVEASSVSKSMFSLSVNRSWLVKNSTPENSISKYCHSGNYPQNFPRTENSPGRFLDTYNYPLRFLP